MNTSIARTSRLRTSRGMLGVFAALLLILGFMPTRSWAGCSGSPTFPIVFYFSYTGPRINPNVPVGSTLATMQATAAAARSLTYSCSPSPLYWYFQGTTGTPSSAVYPSNIPGIGFRVGDSITPSYPGYDYNTPSGYITSSVLMTVTLIKTGPINQGGVLSGEFAEWDNVLSGGGGLAKVASLVFSPSIPVTLVTPSCTVATPSITVPFPDQSAAGFSGVGTTAGTAQSFNITLNCSGGDPGTSTGMYITLTDATNPGNRTDMLSPTAATAGTGVGIRVFRNNGATAVKYGADSNVIGNTNQWQLPTVNPGISTVTIPLTAQYVQIGSTVHAGAVKAIATFTMAYN